MAVPRSFIAGYISVTPECGGNLYTAPTFSSGTNKFTVLLNPTGVQEGERGYQVAFGRAASLADLMSRLATEGTALEQLGS